jgi:hypothetical protein
VFEDYTGTVKESDSLLEQFMFNWQKNSYQSANILYQKLIIKPNTLLEGET